MRNWHAARALLSESEADTERYSRLWIQRVSLAITTDNYAGAEAALLICNPTMVHEASRVHLFRGQIAEARWLLEVAAAHYRDALSPDPNDVHADLAGTSLKLLDLVACRHHLRRMMQLVAFLEPTARAIA